MKVKYIGETGKGRSYWCPELIKDKIYETDINLHGTRPDWWYLYPNVLEVRLTENSWALIMNPKLFENKEFEIVNE